MKQLYKSEATGLSIVIMDENNYAIGKLTERKDGNGKMRPHLDAAKYHNTITSAVTRVCELEAQDACTDLNSFLVEYKAAVKRISNLLGLVQ